MAEEFQSLLDRINREYLQQAETEKEKILSQARAEAESIVAAAKAEADHLRNQAEKDAESGGIDEAVGSCGRSGCRGGIDS